MKAVFSYYFYTIIVFLFELAFYVFSFHFNLRLIFSNILMCLLFIYLFYCYTVSNLVAEAKNNQFFSSNIYISFYFNSIFQLTILVNDNTIWKL